MMIVIVQKRIYSEFFKNTFFIEHRWMTASGDQSNIYGGLFG